MIIQKKTTQPNPIINADTPIISVAAIPLGTSGKHCVRGSFDRPRLG